jgi:hypothetical protein
MDQFQIDVRADTSVAGELRYPTVGAAPASFAKPWLAVEIARGSIGNDPVDALTTKRAAPAASKHEPATLFRALVTISAVAGP